MSLETSSSSSRSPGNRSTAAERNAKFGQEVMEVQDNQLWDIDFENQTTTTKPFKPTVHTLAKKNYLKVLASRKLDFHLIERHKGMARREGKSVLIARITGGLHAYSSTRDECDEIECLEIWSYHDEFEVKVVWPPEQLTPEESETFDAAKQQPMVLTDELYRLRKTVEILNQVLDNKNQEIAGYKDREKAMKSTHSEEMEMLEAELEEEKEKRKKAENEKQKKAENKNRRTQEKEEVQVNQREEYVRILKRDTERLKSELENTKQDLEHAQKAAEDLKNLENQRDQLELANEKLKTTVQVQDGKLSTMQELVDELSTEKSLVFQMKGVLEHENNELKAALQEANSKKRKHDETNCSSCEMNHQLKNDNRNLIARMSNLEAEKQNMQQELHRFKTNTFQEFHNVRHFLDSRCQTLFGPAVPNRPQAGPAPMQPPVQPRGPVPGQAPFPLRGPFPVPIPGLGAPQVPHNMGNNMH